MPVCEPSVVVHGKVTKQKFKAVLPRERVTFQVEKYVALGRLRQPGQPETCFHGEQFKSRLASLARFHLNARLLSNADISRNRPALGLPI